jgi:hypothetical protein
VLFTLFGFRAHFVFAADAFLREEFEFPGASEVGVTDAARGVVDCVHDTGVAVFRGRSQNFGGFRLTLVFTAFGHLFPDLFGARFEVAFAFARVSTAIESVEFFGGEFAGVDLLEERLEDVRRTRADPVHHRADPVVLCRFVGSCDRVVTVFALGGQHFVPRFDRAAVDALDGFLRLISGAAGA